MGSAIVSVKLSPNTTSIGERAFAGSSLSSIDLKSVKTIGARALSLTNIRTLDIPSTVEVIPESLCWRATQLYSVTLHDGLKKIDNFAFQEAGLISISFPSTLTYIGTGAFMSTKITGMIAYPHSLTHLDGIVFGDTGVTGYKFPAGIKEGTAIGGFGNVHFYKDGVELTNVDLYNGALWGRIWSGTTTSMTYQGEYVPTFTVSFSANGGSLSPPTSFSASPGDSFSVPSYTGTKTGYTFDYWSCSDGTIAYPGSTKIMPFSDLLLTAHWSGAKHTVYYDVNGGSSTVPSITVSEGEVFSLPSYSGTKSGYSFVGWTLGSTTYNVGYRITMGSSDLTFVASWKSVPSHTAYFDVNGGTPSVPSLTVYEGSNASIPSVSPTKTGYDFDGWTCNGKKYYPSNVFTMGTSDMYFVADWVEHVVTTYTVSYDTKGGSDSVPSQHVQSGSKFSVAYYYGSKTGYTFDGWSYDSSIYYPGSLMTMGNSDITFKAVWKETPQPTPSPGSDVIVIFGFELTYMTLTLIGIIAIMGIALVILLIKRR
ncbi:MAG: hypothetical protein E7Z62_01795 [Thermoplasmata archaeon]|nr:hypothetical protein [Thermoplasmata archaeon]